MDILIYCIEEKNGSRQINLKEKEKQKLEKKINKGWKFLLNEPKTNIKEAQKKKL